MSLSSPSAQATQTAQPSSIAQAATTARCAVRVRFLAALVGIAVAASITSFYVEFGLLSKISFATSATFSDKSIQDRAADTHLHASADENIRIIAMCGGTHLFDDAFRKISEWLPIWYAGMYQRPEDVTIPQQSWCENKIEQWVVSELQRRKMTDISKVTSSIEVIYGGDELFRQKSPLNTTFVGQSNEPPKWEGGMHTPSRPFHIQRHFNYWGEVAWSKGILCSQDDSKIHVYRSRQLWSVAQEENCAVVHLPAILNYVQVFLHHRIQTGLSPANETVLSLLSRRLTRNQARQSLSSKSNFCILITMTTFQPRYSTDALVRHALCRLLTKQYKPCVAIASWKGQKTHNITIAEGLENTSGAMKDFKFAITMPNHFQDGYIAEKTLNPYLASSVAITAIPKIGQYVNAEWMISCHLPEEELRKVQMYYKGDFKWMPFNTTPDMWKSEDKITPIKYDPYANNKKGDEPVLEFATSQWEEALQPCIEEIIRVDQDDSVYMEKLMQPYLLNEGKKSMFDGTYLAMSMLRWFLWANSPLVRGLDDRIKSLDGMMEQTPGWGEPPVKTFEDGVDYYFKTKNEAGVSRPVVQQNIVQQNTVQQGGNAILKILPHSHGGGNATKCAFCDEGIHNQDLLVPNTGGNTCGSIKLMTAGEVNGSVICAIIQKKERVCCPGSS